MSKSLNRKGISRCTCFSFRTCTFCWVSRPKSFSIYKGKCMICNQEGITITYFLRHSKAQPHFKMKATKRNCMSVIWNTKRVMSTRALSFFQMPKIYIFIKIIMYFDAMTRFKKNLYKKLFLDINPPSSL